MNLLTKKTIQATKNILFNNLQLKNKPYISNKTILVYDKNSKLSSLLAFGYIEGLKEFEKKEIIDFDNIDKEILHKKLLSLSGNSTVILVQSTNFRIEDFRIRHTLYNNGVGCLEHNHLGYIKDDEISNYIDAIEYKTPYYNKLSNYLKNLSDSCNKMTFISKNDKILIGEGGFEDMKQNTGDYAGKDRGGSYPIGENFTEIKDFTRLNGTFLIYAYPDDRLQVEFVEPFEINIKNSYLILDDYETFPEGFKKIVDKIRKDEDGEVMVRELGFGLNNGISREKPLSDVNAYERIAGFHISLGKKHGIYRKKLPKKITQKYHIDIFVDIKQIYIDEILIFENEQYMI